MNAASQPIRYAAFLILLTAIPLQAREWRFVGLTKPVEAEFLGMANGAVVMKGENGSSLEVPYQSFSPDDQRYLKDLATAISAPPRKDWSSKAIISKTGYQEKSVESLDNRVVTLTAGSVLHLTKSGDPAAGSYFMFAAPDAWLIFDHVPPSEVISKFLNRMRVNGIPADLDKNVRVAQFGSGAVVIPHGPDYSAMTVFDGNSLGGKAMPLRCHLAYNDKELGGMKNSISSFILKRGYMATIASNENGTGASRNYVAQDHDVVISSLPKELDHQVHFIRIFPWRWVGKKGIAGNIHQNLKVDWFYDWNIGANSLPNMEYVPIRQKRWWPDLRQDWKAKGTTHLLGYNEPDHKDQANLSVGDAIWSWPDLLGTGLRLGSPAVSDGGLNWLFDFMDQADKNQLRVDFVVVHYYRAVPDPGDGRAAAAQFYGFLKQIHDRTHRPIWITEWNNGANWTPHRDPSPNEQKSAVEEMIKMLDKTPFVERYALYNWVEDSRALVRGDGSLTPAGEIYRDDDSPLSYEQVKTWK